MMYLIKYNKMNKKQMMIHKLNKLLQVTIYNKVTKSYIKKTLLIIL